VINLSEFDFKYYQKKNISKKLIFSKTKSIYTFNAKVHYYCNCKDWTSIKNCFQILFCKNDESKFMFILYKQKCIECNMVIGFRLYDDFDETINYYLDKIYSECKNKRDFIENKMNNIRDQHLKLSCSACKLNQH